MEIAAPAWAATGEDVAESMYTSHKDGANWLFTVRDELNGLETIAEVRINPLRDDTPRSRVNHWHGDVARQKWMNFYTKVLSRFAATQDLKLKVTFEVPTEGEQGQAKADEARSGLRELGLNDDVRLT